MKQIIIMMMMSLMINICMGAYTLEDTMSDPESYTDDITDDPDSVAACIECYKAAIRDDPKIAGICSECYEKAISEDASVLDEPEAFIAYSESKNVNFIAVKGNIINFDGERFTTSSASFSLDDLMRMQDDMQLSGFILKQDGSIGMIGKDTYIKGTLDTAYGNIEITGKGTVVQKNRMIRLISGKLILNHDTGITIDGTAEVDGMIIRNMKDIVFIKDGFHGKPGAQSTIDDTVFMSDDGCVIWIRTFDDKKYIAASSDTKIMPGHLDAIFCSDTDYPYDMPITGTDDPEDFRLGGGFIFNPGSERDTIRLSKGMIMTEGSDLYIKQSKEENNKGTHITDIYGRHFVVTEDDVMICNDEKCPALSSKKSRFILFGKDGEITEKEAGLFAMPGGTGSISTYVCEKSIGITGSFGLKDIADSCKSVGTGLMDTAKKTLDKVREWKEKPDRIIRRTDDGTTFFHEYEIWIKTSDETGKTAWIPHDVHKIELQRSNKAFEGYEFFKGTDDNIYVVREGEDEIREFRYIDIDMFESTITVDIDGKATKIRYKTLSNFEYTPYSGEAEELKDEPEKDLLDMLASPEREKRFLENVDMTRRGKATNPDLRRYYEWCDENGYKATVVGAYGGKGAMWNLVVEDPDGKRKAYLMLIDKESAQTLETAAPPGWNSK